MARISQLPANAIPYAQEAMPFSALQRGQGAMIQPNIGMRNQNDGGNPSKPYLNAQEQRNMEQTMQGARVNGQTSIPQRIAGAQGQARRAINEQTNMETKGKRELNTYLTNLIDSRPDLSGENIQMIGRIYNGPVKDMFRNDIARSMNG